MSKIYIQNLENVISYNSSLAKDLTLSGSLHCAGYAKLVGLFKSSASTDVAAACGLHFKQSADYGITWDLTSASYKSTANAASAISIDIVGNAIKVDFYNGGSNSASLRFTFGLRPI